MNARPSSSLNASGNRGFSLVEVTIAIGIFAFVIVGILGLLPAGMRMRADSAAETRGLLIAEELFSAVRSAPSVTNLTFRDGPGLRPGNNRTNINLLSRQVVLGYPAQTTVPYWSFDTSPASSWENSGGRDAEISQSAVNAIDTLARLSAQSLGGGVYRISVEVRAPASLPLTNSRPAVFSTLVYSP